MLSGDLKWGAFRAADVFILPSHQENFGLAVVEALACGVPVLISNRINIRREIQTDRAGLVAADTLAGTRDLLRRWQRLAEGERQAMRVAAARSFRQRFEIERAAQHLVGALRACGVQG
jgi:glycosyltransferase involved in cell wall biosynthesis